MSVLSCTLTQVERLKILDVRPVKEACTMEQMVAAARTGHAMRTHTPRADRALLHAIRLGKSLSFLQLLHVPEPCLAETA